jgi:hypothetical protein
MESAEENTGVGRLRGGCHCRRAGDNKNCERRSHCLTSVSPSRKVGEKQKPSYKQGFQAVFLTFSLYPIICMRVYDTQEGYMCFHVFSTTGNRGGV